MQPSTTSKYASITSLNTHYYDWYIERVFKLTNQAIINFKPDLVVWPESVLISKTPLSKGFYKFQSFIKQLKPQLILGARFVDKKDNIIYNAAYHYINGKLSNLSFKTKLVPYFETDELISADYKNIFLEVKKDLHIGPLLCFEVLFSSLSRGLVRSGATVLICLSNNGYLGRSNWPLLHAAYSVFRSVETGVPIIFANNTGFSIVSDHVGQISHISPFYRLSTSHIFISPSTHDTLFMKSQVYAQILFGMILLMYLINASWKKIKKWGSYEKFQ